GIALMGSIVDRALARRVALTEEIQSQQRWLEAVLNLTPIPLLLIEPRTARVLFANRAANEMAGERFPRLESAKDHDRSLYCLDMQGNRIRGPALPTIRAANGEKLDAVQLIWRTSSGDRALLV